MKKTIKKRLVALSLGCALCVSIGAISLSQRQAEAEIIDCETAAVTELKAQYFIGENLTVPTTKIVYGNEQIDPTDTILVYPNGDATAKSTLALTDAGTYTIVYTANKDGKTLQAEKTFSVVEHAYTFGMEESSIEYQDELGLSVEGEDGMFLTLSSGDTFTYNKPIDLYANGGNAPFISFRTWHRNKVVDGWTEKEQAKYLYFRLTDCYNPEIYVEYVINWSQDRNMYCRAGSNHQDSIGMMVSENVLGSGEIVYLDGAKRRVHRNTWGQIMNSVSPYQTVDGNVNAFKFVLDTNDYKAYAIDYRGTTQLLNAMRSDILHGDNPFVGFTTGEAFLSIYGGDWQSSEAYIDILQIGGDSGAALNVDNIQDTAAPIIQIEKGLDSFDDIKIALGEEFEIPKATVLDINNIGDAQTAVYMNYGKAAQTLVSSRNGKFTPTRAGLYTIEYTATDAYGQTTVKTLDLRCIKATDNVGINFAVSKLTALQAGVEATLPDYTVSSLNDSVTVKTSYIRLDADGNEVEKAEITDGTFIPYYKGTYKIVYEYANSVKSYTYSYDVACNESDAITMIESPYLPKYLLKGYTYSFDKFYVYTFANGAPNPVLTDMKVRMDDGEFAAANYGSVYVSASNKVDVRFEYGEWTSQIYSLPVIDAGGVGSLKMQELFVGNVDKLAGSGSVSCTTKSIGDVKVDYANVLSVSNFKFKFDIPESYDNFDELEITLTDFYDEDNKVVFSYSVNEDKKTMFTLDGQSYLLDVTSFTGSLRNVMYIAATSTLKDTTGASVKYPIDFTSDKAFFSMTFKGVKTVSKINVWELNNQSFSSVEMDLVNPEVLADKVEGGIKKLGDIVTVYPISVIDVITPTTSENVKVTVRGPDKKVVNDLNGNPINNVSAFENNYEFEIEQTGKYTITYTYSDQSGNENFINYSASVRENVAPTISVNASRTEIAKLNDVIQIASYTVSDNETSADNLISFTGLLTPNEEMLRLNGDSFKATQRGVWVVYYYCCDEAGNYSVASYEIIVS